MCAYTKFVQNHHLKMSCRWKSFKLSCMEKKISQKKRFYFCRVIGRSIKTWLIFTITCSTWLAVCWEMLRGINSGERDKVESLIDSQSWALYLFSKFNCTEWKNNCLLKRCCWKKEKKKKNPCISVGFELKIRNSHCGGKTL